MRTKFLGYYSDKPIPNKGWLVMDGSITLRIPKEEGSKKVLAIIEQLGPYIRANEWLVVCDWTHTYYLTTKKHMMNRAEAKRYCIENNRRALLNCLTGKAEII